VTPATFVSHPSYNSNTNENDFAIITLQTDVAFSTSIIPVCLPLSGGSVHENK
jgi:hypothetical protein